MITRKPKLRRQRKIFRQQGKMPRPDQMNINVATWGRLLKRNLNFQNSSKNSIMDNASAGSGASGNSGGSTNVSTAATGVNAAANDRTPLQPQGSRQDNTSAAGRNNPVTKPS